MTKKEVLLGDCLELMKDIPNGSIDAIITDPPYGTTACKWDSVIDFELMWEQLNRIIKPNGAIVLFGSEPFSSALRMSNIKNYKYDWVWEKSRGTNFLQAEYQPLKKHENILIFYNSKPNFNKQYLIKKNPDSMRRSKRSINDSVRSGDGQYKLSGKSKENNNTYKNPESVIYFKNVTGNNQFSKDKVLHPTQKPLDLMEYLIKTYTNENETVLDFTAGSGTTAIACLNTKRQFIVMEKEQKYYDIILKRIEDFNNNLTLF